MKIKWYAPDEKLPPYDKPVMLDLKFPYVGLMHAYGWFTETGWKTISLIKNYRVEKWAYFVSDKENRYE